ncbi:MAG: 2-C-methyl-D-erythritol 4-phosphate cytidylyltransferase [Caldiserica bacterium]|nr:2-C-methyl-D-erythritol 4-phosphate cytidylyltransferase [Caldisericota bacterium]
MRGDRSRASAVILAAGRGERLGAPIGKALVELSGKPLLRWSAEAFVASGAVVEVVAVARPGEEAAVEGALAGLGLPWRVVPGGERRQDSSLAGISAAAGEYVLIHDAARPLVGPDLIRAVLEATVRHGAAVPVIPVRDTLRYAAGGFLRAEGPDRAGLYAIQTPQGFRRELIRTALEDAVRRGFSLTDDAGAVLLAGGRVAVVPGEARNLKVTYPEDLELARALLSFRG